LVRTEAMEREITNYFLCNDCSYRDAWCMDAACLLSIRSNERERERERERESSVLTI
jgi:hypothetical protein